MTETKVPPYEQVTTIRLLDVQGLFGGRSVFLKRDGTAVVQVVTPPKTSYPEGGLTETRFEFQLGREDADRIFASLRKHSFMGIQIQDRYGVPDEARPEITIRFASGESRSVVKWANDSHPQFDPIYQGLLGLERRTPSMKPVREGRYDPRWMPEGFVR